MNNAPSPAVLTSALSRRFDGQIAVDAVDLRVERGAFFGLIGSNGAGKTTLIEMLITLLPPSSGNAQVAGFDLAREAREVRRHIGYVPQLISADAALTARENLSLSAKLHAIYPIDVMPGWLKVIAHVNPLSYLVDALRTLMVRGGATQFGLLLDVCVQLAALVPLVTAASRLYPAAAR